MTMAFLGFTFLIAAFFQFGDKIIRLFPAILPDELWNSLPPIFFELLMLILTYVPAVALTAWFFRAARLPARVPAVIPGSMLMAIGVALSALYLVTGIVAASLEGRGGSYTVMQYVAILLWPAHALLAIGAAKFLLAMAPSHTAHGDAIETTSS